MDYNPFSTLSLDNSFFDSLKQDYKEFEDWFKKKQKDQSKAYVEVSGNPPIIYGFLYLKIEEEELSDIQPILPAKKRLKVGTFKVDAHGTKFGQRFIKKIMDHAIMENVEEVYLTIFPKHVSLISLITKYGFAKVGTKTTSNGIEDVYLKNIKANTGNILFDYPLINISKSNKYLLSIYPEYHTRLFPDSILKNESYNLIEDVSATNSIHKIYICFMPGCSLLKPNDLLLIYRTSDGKGAAKYRSVVTSVCTVQEMKTRTDFKDIDSFISYSSAYSIFAESELTKIWNSKIYGAPKNFFVIKMLYNAAFNKRVINDALKNTYKIGTTPGTYWGFLKLTDDQFRNVLKGGNVSENIIVD